MKQNGVNRDEWYEKSYNQVNATAIPNSIVSKVMHRLIEKQFKSNSGLRILEVGANQGEHLQFVASDYKSYLLTDIRSIEISDNLKDKRNNFQIADVQNLPFEDQTFDRVVSTCLFHHIDDPMKGFDEVRRVTKQGGMITILIPNDPGIMYRLLRNVTTLRNAKRLGILKETQLVHALEHKNHYLQLHTLLLEIFIKDSISTVNFPFLVKSYNLNALTVFNISKNN